MSDLKKWSFLTRLANVDVPHDFLDRFAGADLLDDSVRWRLAPASPRDRLPFPEEAAGRAAVGQGSQPERCVGALFRCERGLGAAHAGAYPPRAGRIDQDVRTAQRIGQQDRNAVQQGFGQAVGRREHCAVRTVRAAHVVQRAQGAGHIDDAAVSFIFNAKGSSINFR